jgi:hypothetical protein
MLTYVLEPSLTHATQRCGDAKPGTVDDLLNARGCTVLPFLSTVGSTTAVFEAAPTHT